MHRHRRGGLPAESSPPPANGSTTSGRVPGMPPSASWAACVIARLVSRYAGTVELSQFAKSAMKSSNAIRSTNQFASSAASSVSVPAASASHRPRDSTDSVSCNCRFSSVIRSEFTRFANAVRTATAASRNAREQSGSTGSGHSAAQMTARHAASGLRAHQMCSVEICPCRIDFSRRACAEMRAIGRSTSMRRLG